MKALLTLPECQAGVRDVPVPNLEANQILVRVKAVALNPVDALYVAKPASLPGRVVGSDFAGVVVTPAARWKRGDRVAGFLHGACQENSLPGAFAEFVVVDADLVYGIPEEMDFEEAATLPLCVQTASNGIFRVLSLSKPWEAPPAQVVVSSTRAAILIYSAATSVGCYAVQLARLSPTNPLIITTASLSNKSYLESLGADYVIDYHDDGWVEKVRELVTASKAELKWAVDCISEGETVSTVSRTFTAGGKIATVRGPTQWTHDLKRGVEAEYMAVWTMLGKEFWYNGGVHFPAQPSHRALAAALYAYISSDNVESPLVTSTLKPNKVRLMEGGLEKVPEAFEFLGAGRVTERKIGSNLRPLKAEKIVYRLMEEEKEKEVRG